MSVDDRRLRFERAVLQTDERGSCRVEVTFSFGARLITSTAEESDQAFGRLKAAVVATLDAVEQAVGGRFSCVLANLDYVTALGKDLIAVLVDIEFDGKQFQLFGSCQKLGNDVDVAVKAALNATNRFVVLALDG